MKYAVEWLEPSYAPEHQWIHSSTYETHDKAKHFATKLSLRFEEDQVGTSVRIVKVSHPLINVD